MERRIVRGEAEDGPRLHTGWWLLGLIAAALFLAGIAIWWSRAEHEGASPALPRCLGALTVRTSDVDAVRRADHERVREGAGVPDLLVEIADWDPGIAWAFRTRERLIVDEGVFVSPDTLDMVRTEQTSSAAEKAQAAAHYTYIGREFWDDNPNLGGASPKRQHCALAVEHVLVDPMRIVVTAAGPSSPSSPEGGDTGGAVVLRPGVRLRAEPGTPTTVDGEPGTAYVWSPAEDPWLRAEFVLDGRNRLRSATITDTVRNEVVGEFSARPTDARIQPPDWAG
jgi:hypothetical protein